MATSGTTTFESSFFIDDIITEAYERIGMFDYSGNNIKTARAYFPEVRARNVDLKRRFPERCTNCMEEK